MLSIPAAVLATGAQARSVFTALLDAFVASLDPLRLRLSAATRHVVVIEQTELVLRTFAKGRLGSATRLGEGMSAPDAFRTGVVELRLPPDLFLSRSLRLPNAGRGYLQPIIAHRLDRLTPWRADKVLYGYSVVEGVSEDGTIAVDLLATSVDLAAPYLTRLEAAGLHATLLGSAAEPLDAALRFDLYRDRVRPADGQRRTTIARVFAVLLAALSIIWLLSSLLAASASADLRDTEARLVTLRTKLAQRGGPGLSRQRGLIEAKQPDKAVIVLIDRLSRALPDDTVLRELDIDPTRIRLVGRSADAPALIARLESEVALRNLRFAAPVIRDADRRDAFDLVATRGETARATR